MSRETRIGILSVLVIAISIWGYKFIKGQNLLSSQQFFYIEYDDVAQMQQSSPVYNRGLQIGTVTDIYKKPDNYKKVIVEIEVNKKFKVPKATLAVIKQTAMGDKSINLEFDEICDDPNCAKSGDFLIGSSLSVLGSMMAPNELEAYMVEVTKGLKEVTKSMNEIVNDPDNVIGKSMSDLQATMANLKTMTGLLNKELRQNGKVNDILENVNKLTASIEGDKMASILSNTDSITTKINAVNLKEITDNTNETMAEAKAAIAKMNQTMENAELAITELNTLLAGINKGEGSLGKIVKDEKFYDELKAAVKSTNILMTDLQQRPQRYIPFKSGRKVRKVDRKTPLVMPEKEGVKKN